MASALRLALHILAATAAAILVLFAILTLFQDDWSVTRFCIWVVAVVIVYIAQGNHGDTYRPKREKAALAVSLMMMLLLGILIAVDIKAGD